MASQRRIRTSSQRRRRPRRTRRRAARAHRRPPRALATAGDRLRRLGKATLLALAVTALLVSVVEPGFELVPSAAAAQAQQPPAAPDAEAEGEAEEDSGADEVARATRDEVRRTATGLRGLLRALAPKLAVIAAVIVIAWLLTRLVRPLLRLTLGRWPKGHAIQALTMVAIWVVTFGVVVSVLAGDIRGTLGSVGLVGLALSWALQSPIESFTGWLLNSFRGYYRVGDRVLVGDAFGDVYRVDVLTTTLWEIGNPGGQGAVQAEQPTGRLITFPNSELLNGTVVNVTREFSCVWDELTVPVASTSDMAQAIRVLEQVSTQVLGEMIARAASRFRTLLQSARIDADVADRPQVFASMGDTWMNLTVRYVVPPRERRVWKSRLTLAIHEALLLPENRARIESGLPRQQVELFPMPGEAAGPERRR